MKPIRQYSSYSTPESATSITDNSALVIDRRMRNGARRLPVEQYMDFPIEALRVGEHSDAKISVVREGLLEEIKPIGRPLPKADLDRLLIEGHRVVKLWCKTEAEILKVCGDNLEIIFNTPEVPTEMKARVAYSIFQNIYGLGISDLQNGASVRQLLKVVHGSIELLGQPDSPLKRFFDAASQEFSEVTHSLNVAAYSLALAKKMGIYQRHEMETIGLAALAHDIGKVKIDRRIIEKQGELSPEEYAEMKRHVEYGFDIFKKAPDSHSDLAALIILQHHERMSGKGYPTGCTEGIHLFSRIVGITEFFDSLTMDRGYKKPLSSHDAIKFLFETSRTDFDKSLYVALINTLRESG